MQLEMENPCCSLCKRRLPGSASSSPLDTKLCQQCQMMIGKAMRINSKAALAQGGVVTALAQTAMPLEQIQFELPEDEAVDGIPAAQATPFELFDDGSIPAQFIEPKSQAPVFFDLDDVEPVVPEGEGSHLETQPQYAESPDASDDQSPSAAQEPVTNAYTPADRSHVEYDDSNNGDKCEVRDEFELDSASGEMTTLTDTGEAAADPWDDPLPAWDYSRNEWPVLLGPDQQSAQTKHRTIFAALALVVIAALIYFLVFRPGSPEQHATAATNSSAQESAGASEPEAPAAEPTAAGESGASQPAASGAQNEPAPSASEDSKAAAVAASTEGDNTYASNGRYSLQAAAFPTEQGASEFAEKLRRAGVPSYIISADIARRGRWFRVRVGRFNNAADAARFAAEAQMRAGAAGLSLQLMTCQYEQP